MFGYYGKLPFAGDFLRHGLPPAFVSDWDEWIQKTLVRARHQMGEAHWSTAYLCAPIWRFSVAPGLCGPQGAVGIMMPSLDLVGRRFPFCIASPTHLPPVAAYLALQPMAARLEDLALEMIDGSGCLAALNTGLAQLRDLAPPPHAADLGRGAGSLWVTTVMDQARVMVVPDLPTRPIEAAALFDPAAPYWNQMRLTRHEA